MFTGQYIKELMDLGVIQISDFDESRLNPNSYNLRLDGVLYTPESNILDAKDKNIKYTKIEIPDEGFVLEPNKLYIGSTMETTTATTIVPCINGRSSLGRLGLNVHATAGFGDIGFSGTWTLELFVVQPLRIYKGMEICQIYFFKPEGKITKFYHGKYLNQIGPTTSRIYEELD